MLVFANNQNAVLHFGALQLALLVAVMPPVRSPGTLAAGSTHSGGGGPWTRKQDSVAVNVTHDRSRGQWKEKNAASSCSCVA